MKTVFEKKDVNFGCYDSANKYRVNTPNTFDINYVLGLSIPLKDKFWFVRNNCELTDRQFRELAIGVAAIVLPIYEAKYPTNKAPREAIQAAQDYLDGVVSLEELKQKRWAAHAACDVADDAAVYAAYATAYAACDVLAADDACDAADDAVLAADDDTFKQQLLDFLKNFTNN